MLTYEQALEKLLAAAQPVEEDPPCPAARRRRPRAGRRPAVGRLRAAARQFRDGRLRRAHRRRDDCRHLPAGQPAHSAAGTVGVPLQPGSAARIFTGAPIPAGADAVVMQERCEHGEGGVVINQVPKSGENIRRAGEDITAGADILPAGVKLRPQEIALAASAGLPEPAGLSPRTRRHVLHRR